MAAKEAAAKRQREHKVDAPNAAAPQDLADPAVQDAILNPEGIEIVLFGDPVTLFPLALKQSFKFTGFTARVLGASNEGKGTNILLRVGSVLADYIDEFIPFLAHALSKPGAEFNVAARVAELDSKIGPAAFMPLASIFLAMLGQNNVIESLGISTNPKN